MNNHALSGSSRNETIKPTKTKTTKNKERRHVRFDNLRVQNEFDFWILSHAFLHHARRSKLTTTVNHVHFGSISDERTKEKGWHGRW